VIKWLTSGAVLAGGAWSRSPTLLVLIMAVVAVVVVIATYVLIARREVAPRIEWGKLKIDFTRLPKQKNGKR
jgi:hypothetical protein